MKKFLFVFLILSVFAEGQTRISGNVPYNGYNVKDYGCLANGVANDQAAFERLINVTVPNGSIIFIPANCTLVVGATTTTTRTLVFRGCGSNSVVKVTHNGRFLDVAPGVKCQFLDLHFMGTGSGANQYAVYMPGQSGSFLFNNCWFDNFGGGGLAVGDTHISTYLGGQIIGCKFFDCLVGLQAFSRAEYLQVIGCDFFDNATGLSLAGGNFILDGNNINYNTIAIDIVNGTNDGHGIISNNNINHNSSIALRATDQENGLTITDNHIYEGAVTFVSCYQANIVGGIVDVGLWTITNSTVTIQDLTFFSSYGNSVSITGTVPNVFRCKGDVPASFVNSSFTWVDYSATSTVTGWTTFSTKQIRYMVQGRTLIVDFNISGTSNSTNLTFTLPFSNIASVPPCVRGVYGVDNGTALTSGGVAYVDANSNLCTVYKTWDLTPTNWTNSGTKTVTGRIEIELTN